VTPLKLNYVPARSYGDTSNRTNNEIFNYTHFSIYIYNKSRTAMAKAVFNEKEALFDRKLDLKKLAIC